MPIFSAGSASVSIVPDFSNAQRAITEWFAAQRDMKVKVEPNLSQTDVARIEAELNAMHGEAKVEVDHNYLASSIATGLHDALGASGLSKLSAVVNAAIGPALVAGAVGALTELVAAASQAIGVLALVPAGILAIAAPAAVVALGVQGMGAAFKALDTGNAQKISQAMDKLAPSAQQVVLAVHALGPAFTALRLDVQQNLWAGLGTSITSLAQVALPVLRTGLSGIAADLNSGLKATFATLQGLGPEFTTIFNNLVVSGRSWAGTMAPLTDAFIRMAAVGSQFLPGIADGFLRAANAADQWVQHAQATGELTRIIQAALTVIDQLGHVLINVGGIVQGILAAAIPYGNVLLGMLVKLTAELDTFVHSTVGQTALASFFSEVNKAVAILLPVFTQLVEALLQYVVPALGSLAANLAPVIALLGTQLVSVIKAVSGFVPPLTKVIADLVSAFAPLIPQIGTIITALLPPLLVVLEALVPVISAFTATVANILVKAVQALAPALAPVGKAFVDILAAVEPLIIPISNLALQLLPPLASVLKELAPVIAQTVQVLAEVAKVVLQIVGATVLPVLVVLINAFAAGLKVLSPILGPMAGVIITIVAAVKLWTLAQTLLDIALDANPIGILIIAIGLLVAAIGLIATHTKELGQLWSTVWGFIRDTALTVWDALKTAWNATVGALVTAWNAASGALSSAWNAFWGAIKTAALAIWSALQTAWSALVNGFQTIWNAVGGGALAGAWNVTWNAMKTAALAIWSALQTAWSAFTGAINSIWSAASGTLSLGWSTIWNAMKTAALAIWSALQIAWSAFTSAINSIWSAASNALSSAWSTSWNAMKTAALAIWSALQIAWSAFTSAINSIWSAASNALSNSWNAIWNALKTAALAIWSALQAAWSAFTGAINSIWSAASNALSNAWNATWNAIKAAAQAAWSALQSGWSAVTNAIQSIFNVFSNGLQAGWNALWNGLKNAVTSIWDGIKRAVATPINFVINTVLNGGLFRGWNSVVDFLHLPLHIPNIAPIPGYAGGGLTGMGIFGTGGKYDPAGIVHAKEFVVNQEQTAKHLPLLEAINSGARGFADGGLAGLPGYAPGGLVSSITGALGATWGSVTDIFNQISGSLTQPLQSLLSTFTNSPFVQDLGSMAKSLLSGAWSGLQGQIGNAFTTLLDAAKAAAAAVASAVTTGSVSVVPSSRAANVAAVQNAAAAYGWNTGVMWNDLVAVIMRESGFNNTAQNPTSTAYGIFQFLDSTWRQWGGKTSDPNLQARYGLQYIASRYGNPAGALAHEQQFGWYDQGGWLPPGYSTVYNGTGGFEAVLNKAQQSAMVGAAVRSSGDVAPVWHFYLGDREITDLVDARVVYHSGRDGRTIRSSM